MAIRSYLHLLILEEIKSISFLSLIQVLKHTIYSCIQYIFVGYLLWCDAGDTTLNNTAYGVYILMDKIGGNKEKILNLNVSTMKKIYKMWCGDNF